MNDSKLPPVVSLASKREKKQRQSAKIVYLDGSIDCIVCDLIGAAIESPGMVAFVVLENDGEERVIALVNSETIKKIDIEKVYA